MAIAGKGDSSGDFQGAHLGQSVVAAHIKKAQSTLLAPAEKLLGAFHGTALAREEYGTEGLANRKGGWALHDYLLVTDARVVMWARGVFKQSVDAFHYGDIASVEESKGFLFGELVLNIRGAKERFSMMAKPDTPIAARLIRERIAAERSGTRPSVNTVTAGGAAGDIAERLQRLNALKDQGLISEGEFAAQRQRIIDQV